ncbi:MAG: helix-turn-helix domain-containing protein [Gammaproteobacteria bacterium]
MIIFKGRHFPKDILLTCLAAFAEYEAGTRAGLQAVKRRGVRLGRPEALTQAQKQQVRKMYQDGERMADIARAMGVPYHTIRRACGRMA